MQGVFPIAYGPLGHGKGGLLDHPVVAQVAQAADKTPAEVCAISPLLLLCRCAAGLPLVRVLDSLKPSGHVQ